MADVATEPTRELGNVALTGDVELKEGAEALSIYATSPTIECTEETSGDVDARGIMQGIAFEHPGDSADVKNFTEVYLNKGVIILTRSCDGSAAGRYKYFGNVCNPLFLSVERTDTKEANKRKFTSNRRSPASSSPGSIAAPCPPLPKHRPNWKRPTMNPYSHGHKVP